MKLLGPPSAPAPMPPSSTGDGDANQSLPLHAAPRRRADGRRLASSYKYVEIEGDLYHGYPSSLLLSPLLTRACDACAERWS